MMNDSPIHVLLVEDDRRLAELTRTYLESHDVTVTLAHDGVTGLALTQNRTFDTLLLDIMLPGMDGLDLCRRIREHSDVPIIMITARGEEADRVMGLELGADDYIPKPFSPRELLARIRTTVRRARGQLGPKNRSLAVGDLVLEPGARAATLSGRALPLTSYEFAILYALVDRRGRVLSREQLMSLAEKSPEESFDRSVDVHISHLRQKLGDDPRKPKRIKTVRGVGYIFSDAQE
jgi:two-component system response regulator RstA